ncbi:hypothetical protein BDF22DRAFT_742827 [Syncephalis plumigaleata]|nr:hypothetical protein BDF22DRAFT_742827 [Syncephalis plumigaleata]
MLLDDRIIWSQETSPDRYLFKGQLMLLEAFVTDLADTAFYSHAFRVVSGDGNEVVFCCDNGASSKRKWIQQIQEVLMRHGAVISGYMPVS